VSRNAFRLSTEVPRNGAYRPQSSARITSISDTVSTRSAAATAYFLTISSTARVYIAYRNFFPSNRSHRRSHHCRMRISLLVFNIFRYNFTRPDRFSRSPLAFITFAAVPPKSIINVQIVPLRSPDPRNRSPLLDSAIFTLSWSSKPPFTIVLHRFSPFFPFFLLSLYFDSVHRSLVSSIFRWLQIILTPSHKKNPLNNSHLNFTLKNLKLSISINESWCSKYLRFL